MWHSLIEGLALVTSFADALPGPAASASVRVTPARPARASAYYDIHVRVVVQ
jgi:hypothetical protein